MTKEEITDVDLDVVNCLKRLPQETGYAHYYFNVSEHNVATIGSGDVVSLAQGFGAILSRDDEGSEYTRNAMLSAVLAYLNDNKGAKRIFKKALKLKI